MVPRMLIAVSGEAARVPGAGKTVAGPPGRCRADGGTGWNASAWRPSARSAAVVDVVPPPPDPQPVRSTTNARAGARRSIARKIAHAPQWQTQPIHRRNPDSSAELDP